MLAALTDTQAITFAVVILIMVAATAALIRIVTNRQDPTWKGFRVGFFIERERTVARPKRDAEEEADTLDWSTRAP